VPVSPSLYGARSAGSAFGLRGGGGGGVGGFAAAAAVERAEQRAAALEEENAGLRRAVSAMRADMQARCGRDAAEMRPRCGRDSETEVVVRPDLQASAAQAAQRQADGGPGDAAARAAVAAEAAEAEARAQHYAAHNELLSLRLAEATEGGRADTAPIIAAEAPARPARSRASLLPFFCLSAVLLLQASLLRRRVCALEETRGRLQAPPRVCRGLVPGPFRDVSWNLPLQAQLRDLRTAATAATALGGTGAGSGGSGGGEGGDAEAVRVLQGKLSALTARLADRTSLGEGG